MFAMHMYVIYVLHIHPTPEAGGRSSASEPTDTPVNGSAHCLSTCGCSSIIATLLQHYFLRSTTSINTNNNEDIYEVALHPITKEAVHLWLGPSPSAATPCASKETF